METGFFIEHWPQIQEIATALWTVDVTIAGLWTAYQNKQIKDIKKGSQ